MKSLKSPKKNVPFLNNNNILPDQTSDENDLSKIPKVTVQLSVSLCPLNSLPNANDKKKDQQTIKDLIFTFTTFNVN